MHPPRKGASVCRDSIPVSFLVNLNLGFAHRYNSGTSRGEFGLNGSSVVTIRSRREFRSELEEREVQALACGSVPSVKNTPSLVTDQVKLGLTKLEFRDQLLVFLDAALGTRRGEPRRPALVGLQLRQYELQRSAFVLTHRRTSQVDENGSVGQGLAHPSGVEGCVAGEEVPGGIQETWGFRFPVTSPQREEAVGPCGCSQEDPTRVCESWHHPRGLAYP